MPDHVRSHLAGLQERFVILSAPRSGSNMLCTMLDSHPGILCHHEIFNPKGIRLALPLRDTNYSLGSMTERDNAPKDFLAKVWSYRPGIECVGFKFTHRQNEQIFNLLLAEGSIAKIILRRRNRLKTYVSQKISEALWEWEVYQQKDLSQERPRIHVDTRHFLERVAFDEAYFAEIRQAMEDGGHPWIEVIYEDLFFRETQDDIIRFLGLEPVASGLRIGSIKQNSCDLRELISNFDELHRQFNATEFEQELADLGN